MKKDPLHLINQASRQISKSFNDRFTPIGLYAAQWAIIRYLHIHGPSTQVQMCTYLSVEAPTMTRTLKRLENSRWIKRTEGTDRREKLISLTEETIDKMPDLLDQVESFREPVYDLLTEEEIAVLTKSLEKIIYQLKQ